MKRILLFLMLFAPALIFSQNFTAQSINVRTVSPDTCNPINIEVRSFLGCINFSVGPPSYSVNGNNIEVSIFCNSSPICAGAISNPVFGVNVTGLNPGTYTVSATALLDNVVTNSISGGSIVVAGCSTVGVNEFSKQNLSIYPNPTSDKLFIDDLSKNIENIRFQLFDIAGKEQSIPLQLTDSRLQLDLSELKSGIYFLQITENGERSVRKILKD